MSRRGPQGPARVALIDKPVGPTSFDVVRRVRHVVGVRRVGHGGTLDPFASGLIVVGVGPATRLLQHALHGAKSYRARVRFGVETDTADLHGDVTLEAAPPGDAASVRTAMEGFVGEILQVPPRHSALKIDGERAYARARRGEEFEPQARPAVVHAFELVAFDSPFAVVDVRCGGGTYVRSLARDLGRELGSAAHLVELRRTSIASVDVTDAIALDDVEAAHAAGRLLRPPVALTAGWPRLALDDERVRAVRHGVQPVSSWWGDAAVPERVALVDAAGDLVAVAVDDGRGGLRLQTVLPEEVAV